MLWFDNDQMLQYKQKLWLHFQFISIGGKLRPKNEIGTTILHSNIIVEVNKSKESVSAVGQRTVSEGFLQRRQCSDATAARRAYSRQHNTTSPRVTYY